MLILSLINFYKKNRLLSRKILNLYLKIITMRFFFLLILTGIFILHSVAQSNTDSLIRIIEKTHKDSAKINLLNKISAELVGIDNNAALKYAEQAKNLSEKIGDNKYLSLSLYNIGCAYKDMAEYNKCLDFLKQSLQLRREMKDEIEISASLANIGLVYKDMNQSDKSQQYLSEAMQISERIHDLNGLANAKSGLGSLFWKNKNFAQALIHFMEVLEIRERLGVKKDMAISMNNLGMVYKDYANFSMAKEFYQKSLDISRSIVDIKTEANTLNLIGGLFWDMKLYGEAIEYYLESLKLREKIGNKKDIAASNHNIGSVFKSINHNTKALYYYEKALEFRKELGDESLLSYTLNDMGTVYKNLKNYEKALELYNEALEIRRNLADKIGIAGSYKNIGIIYKEKKQYDVAVLTYEKALALYEETNDKRNVANVLNYIGNVFLEKNKTNDASEYYKKALNVSHEAGYKEGIIFSNLNLADLTIKKGQKKESIPFLEEALNVARDIDLKEALLRIYDLFNDLYSGMGDYKKAWDFKCLHAEIKDSLMAEENIKKIAEVQVKYLVYKQDKEMSEKKFELFQKQSQLATEKNIRYFLLFGLLIILLVLFLLYRQYKTKKRSNIKLAAQKNEIEKQSQLLEFANVQLQEKNTQITDSIHYAKLIQEAILPREKYIKESLPDSFIHFKPRDIVSGDFYWFHKENNFIFFAVVDCTGHGVPGGFMSMIGYTLLNDIVKEKKTFEPAKVLEKLNLAVFHTLNQKESKQDDGMDISFCCIDTNENVISLSLANQSAYFCQDGEIKSLSGDIFSIGGIFSSRVQVNFTTHSFALKKGSVLYMLSDGYADQIGEEGNDKFSTARFEKTLTEINQLPLEKQQEIINNNFLAWKGSRRQIDDVLVTGIRF
ncbi:MAG: hypothetical protein A2309_11865 [Bacteroidetes bacterium RIFOXYB2_FULL_35_7]|nr:MAG: hypothetical protein A2309_11865 [Bacteroidetes bacterium RIFOXYB2_FULL_35_7]